MKGGENQKIYITKSTYLGLSERISVPETSIRVMYPALQKEKEQGTFDIHAQGTDGCQWTPHQLKHFLRLDAARTIRIQWRSSPG